MTKTTHTDYKPDPEIHDRASDTVDPKHTRQTDHATTWGSNFLGIVIRLLLAATTRTAARGLLLTLLGLAPALRGLLLGLAARTPALRGGLFGATAFLGSHIGDKITGGRNAKKNYLRIQTYKH